MIVNEKLYPFRNADSKEEYIAPNYEITLFECDDVVLLSGGAGGEEPDPFNSW